MKKAVCVDLDGVLADYSQGFKGIDRIGDPIPGAVEFTKRLSEFARIVIFTTRCKEYAPGIMGRGLCTAAELATIVEAWLKKHGFTFDEVYIGQGKPIAAAYVDDRAVVCRPQSSWIGFVADETDPDGPEEQYRQALWAAKNMCEG